MKFCLELFMFSHLQMCCSSQLIYSYIVLNYFGIPYDQRTERRLLPLEKMYIYTYMCVCMHVSALWILYLSPTERTFFWACIYMQLNYAASVFLCLWMLLLSVSWCQQYAHQGGTSFYVCLPLLCDTSDFVLLTECTYYVQLLPFDTFY